MLTEQRTMHDRELGLANFFASCGLSEPLLNCPRQLFLSPQLNMSVVVRHIYAAVACDLAGFNSARSYFLTPGNVGTPQGVQTKPGEVAADCSRSNFERLSDTGIPHRPLRIVLLRENPLLRIPDVPFAHPIFVSGCQRSECEYSPAVLGFRNVDITPAMALLNMDYASHQIGVFHCQTENFGNARSSREAGFADQQVRIGKPCEDLHRFVFAKNLLRSHHPPSPKLDSPSGVGKSVRQDLPFLRFGDNGADDIPQIDHHVPRSTFPMQPIQDRFGPHLTERNVTPARQDVALQPRAILQARRLRKPYLGIFDVILQPQFSKPSEKDSSNVCRRVNHYSGFRQRQRRNLGSNDPVSTSLRLLPGERILPMTRTDGVESASGFSRTVRERFFLPIADEPITALAVSALMHLRVLHPHLFPPVGIRRMRHKVAQRKAIDRRNFPNQTALDFAARQSLFAAEFSLNNRNHIIKLEVLVFDYPRLSSLTCLAFQINSAMDEKYDDQFSFQEVYEGLERGSLLRDLANKFPEVFDFGLILMDENQHRSLMHVLKIASEAFEGRERRKVGVERSGLTLLIAIILEAIQQQNWTTPFLNPFSPKELASVVIPQAKRPRYAATGLEFRWMGSKLVN